MKRKQFINQLKKELKYYKKIDSEEIIYYYDEMIQDAVDEGQNEEWFIQSLGPVDEIVKNMVQDDNFIKEVKSSNSNSISNILGGTIKIFSLIVYYFSLFILAIVSISIAGSGLAMIGQSIVYLLLDDLSTSDQWIMIGIIAIGLGVLSIGIGIFSNIFKSNNNIKLYITRKTKNIFRKKEGNDYE